ncbi:MAG: response regulator [Clostridia bacterium]|nr:response regulator [Clostridia bacterium]
MSSTFIIIDDDVNIRMMLRDLIVRNELGRVFCELEEGMEAANEILFYNPDVVIVDMLLPGKDGIGIIEEAVTGGYKGKFIMISQVEDRAIISKAYTAGVVFFINKPINSVEVVSVIGHVTKSLEFEKSFRLIKNTVYNLEETKPIETVVSFDKRIDQVFSDIGIINESGAPYLKDILLRILKKEQASGRREIVMKTLYEEILEDEKTGLGETINLRSLEQKIRRTVQKALTTIALLGIEDYYNIKFMDYSTTLFDLKQVKQEMEYIRNESYARGKINIKKFIEGVCSKIK